MFATTLFIAAFSGCDSTEDTPEPAPSLPPPPCADHDYLPIDTMGELVGSEPDPNFTYTPESLEAILDVLDFGGLGPFPYAVEGWTFRYGTQDRGEPATASGVVIVPEGVEGPLDVVVWLHPTVGAVDACSPSALGVLGNGLAIAFAARQGVVVIAPDYLGLMNGSPASENLHPYIVPEPAALSTLDAIRAADTLASEQGWDFDLDHIVLWGASQGAHAALWADRYQPLYAPEYGLAGVVAAIPPTDLQDIIELAATDLYRASEAFPSVAVSTAQWYDLDIHEVLPPETAAIVLDTMESTCDVLDPAGDIDDVDALFTDTVRAGTYSDGWACALQANRIVPAHLPPSGAPILFTLGGDDQLAFSQLARRDAEALCDQGVELSLLECTGVDHEDGGIFTIPQQEAWARARFAGEALTDSCELPQPVDCPEFPVPPPAE